MNSHLPLLDVLELIRQSTVNTRYLDLLQRAEHAITKGEMISSAFSDTTIVTPAVYEAMRSGEESGQIASSLMNVADFIDEDNEQTVRTLSTLIEPIILITLGVLVALVAVSMFLPMFDLTAMAGGG
jgi:type II secretory pathway component PulF